MVFYGKNINKRSDMLYTRSQKKYVDAVCFTWDFFVNKP